VRSGPADASYLTDALPEDATVEVYRRQPDGWCAIRPPAESFSWVFAQHVEPTGDGLARINKDDVPARVGSRLSARRNEVQVRLGEGEIVEIVGEGDQDGKLWYKIAPPAGEFRWIHARDLIPIGSDGTAWESPPAITTVSLEEPAESRSESPATDLVAPPLASDSAAAWKAADEGGTPATSKERSDDITPIAPEPEAVLAASSPDVAVELSRLELQLSRMVAEPTATWNIEPLEQAAERLLSRSNSADDRAAVKAALAKIDRFAAIHRRHMVTQAGTPQAAAGRMPVVAGISPAEAADATDGISQPQFDAIGVLRPVVSRRPGAPQFALVDTQGQVVTFLTPTPDMNLRPYVGQRVGVVGSRGYIPEFRRGHITAGRVTPLTNRVLR
jgi:hypothetical protein